MPTVKYAISAYVADGTTTDYLITWDYLDDDHITVYVDGTSNSDPQANHTFTKLNNTTLRITDGVGGAIASGAEIEIRRETPLLTRAITFADGSALLAEDLNKNSDYLLYSMQEVLDTVDAAAQDGALAAEVATEALRDETQSIRDETEVLKDTTEGLKNTTGTYLATVQSDATDADNHRIAAAASETAAAASEVASAASEVASAASEAASAASEAASAASETAAATSETNAAASEAAAAASETAAAASETAAATSEANAAASYDNFDDRYLGAKSTIPTVDNDGDALLVGALYWNDVSDAMYVWNGSAWDTLPTSIGIADGATSTQVTITDTEFKVSNNFNLGAVTATNKAHFYSNSTTGSPEGFVPNGAVLRIQDQDHSMYLDGNGIVSDINSSSFFLGTTGSAPIRFYTDGTERMALNTNGTLSISNDVELNGSNIKFNDQKGLTFHKTSKADPADVMIRCDGENLQIIEPEDVGNPQATGSSGKLWAEFRDDGGLLMYNGYAPNYESGWFTVSTSGSGNNYSLTHNLNTRNLHAVVMFRVSTNATWFVSGGNSGQAMINTANGSADAVWAGYGLEFPTDNQGRIYVANQYVFATDNSYTYGGGQTNNRWTSGQMKVALYRIGALGGE